MPWIFQGNPKVFDIEDYLARYPELIYWRVPRFQAEIAVGDRAFIWRAGFESGLVASGVVVEAPGPAAKVLHPEALGDDLWFVEKPTNEEPKVGIKLDSVRLSAAEGMLPRAIFKDDPLLKESNIIRMPQSTVFRLEESERKRIEDLWGSAYEAQPEEVEPSAIEGKLQLRAHRRRERSRFLVKKKMEEFRRIYGSLHCEVCILAEATPYPTPLAAKVFEVHHTSPLAAAATPRRTTLADLAVVCANCHRAIHATSDAEENMKTLQQLLANGI